MEYDINLQAMDDELNFSGKLKTTSIYGKWKTTLILQTNGRRPQFLRQIQDDLNFSDKWKMSSICRQCNTTSICRQWKTNLIFQANGRRPQFLRQMQDSLNFSCKLKQPKNGRRPQLFCSTSPNQRKHHFFVNQQKIISSPKLYLSLAQLSPSLFTCILPFLMIMIAHTAVPQGLMHPHFYCSLELLSFKLYMD